MKFEVRIPYSGVAVYIVEAATREKANQVGLTKYRNDCPTDQVSGVSSWEGIDTAKIVVNPIP